MNKFSNLKIHRRIPSHCLQKTCQTKHWESEVQPTQAWPGIPESGEI